MKYLGIILTKVMKELSLKTTTTLLKEIKEDTISRLEVIPLIGRLILKIVILPKAIYRLNVISIKIPNGVENSILKFI